MKAVGLFSGGLDSMLAIKLIQSQGIEVQAVTFVSNFFGKAEKLKMQAEENDFSLDIVDVKAEYLDVVRSPRYGYGKNLNPCIDCKIFMLKKAKSYAEKIGAKFIFTGEVIGQRPMSQGKPSLDLIFKRAEVEDWLVRPLCAKHLPLTRAEQKGWIDREQLLDLQGRSRERQLELAKKYNLKNTQSPGGGCPLTERGYTDKLKNLWEAKDNFQVGDVDLLKMGRFFTVGQSIIVVGKNKEDNEKIVASQQADDYLFEVKDSKSPIVLLRGEKSEESIQRAAELTARYSDAEEGRVVVCFGEEWEQVVEVGKE